MKKSTLVCGCFQHSLVNSRKYEICSTPDTSNRSSGAGKKKHQIHYLLMPNQRRTKRYQFLFPFHEFAVWLARLLLPSSSYTQNTYQLPGLLNKIVQKRYIVNNIVYFVRSPCLLITRGHDAVVAPPNPLTWEYEHFSIIFTLVFSLRVLTK